MNRRGLSALSDSPKWPHRSASRLNRKKGLTKAKMAAVTAARHVGILEWFISATACLGNMIISPVPYWQRQIWLTRLKLIGPEQKWEPIRLELSGWEKWSTLLLKGEKVSAFNSTAVVAMESHFSVLQLKRPDWTALITTNVSISWREAERRKTSATRAPKFLQLQ